MLSICLIARDEERWMESFLSHLMPLKPELILVDTGSKDATKQIAQKYGARIVDSPWEDDFSKPRNLSLEIATRPWILVVDPDERISERDIPRLERLMIEKGNVKAFAFQTRNYFRIKPYGRAHPCTGEFPDELDYSFFTLSCKVRLFKNGLGIRFKGVVHETVTDGVVKVCRPGEFEECDILIHHYGSDPSIAKPKNKRELYRRLTEKKILDEPHNPDAFVEFAHEFLSVRDFDRALFGFKRAYELDPSCSLYLVELIRAAIKAGRKNESEQYLRLALTKDPSNPEYRQLAEQIRSL